MRPQQLGAVGRGLGLLADTWTLLILQRAFLGISRYAGWRETLNISDATLSARLRGLVEAGLLETCSYADGGRERRGYVLTERGGDIWKLLICTWDWEKTWVPREVPLPEIVHRDCGRPTRVRVCCATCGDVVGPRDTEAEREPWAQGLDVLARRHPRRTRGTLPADPLSFLPGAMEIIGDRWGAAVIGAALTGVRAFSCFAHELAISRRCCRTGCAASSGSGCSAAAATASTDSPTRGAPASRSTPAWSVVAPLVRRGRRPDRLHDPPPGLRAAAPGAAGLRAVRAGVRQGLGVPGAPEMTDGRERWRT